MLKIFVSLGISFLLMNCDVQKGVVEGGNAKKTIKKAFEDAATLYSYASYVPTTATSTVSASSNYITQVLTNSAYASLVETMLPSILGIEKDRLYMKDSVDNCKETLTLGAMSAIHPMYSVFLCKIEPADVNTYLDLVN